MSSALANMSSTPKPSTPIATTAKRSTRVQSPAPRPLEEHMKEKAATTTSEEANVASDTKKGLHSSVLASLVAIPLAIFAVMLVAISPAVRGHVAQVIARVVGLWASVNTPIENLVKQHSDALVVMGALMACMPVLSFLAVTVFRATCDVRHFPLWQKISLGALVSTAMVTLGWFTDIFVLAYGCWVMVRMPIQKFIETYAGHIVAASAFVVMAPLGLFVVVTIYRCFTDCGPKNAAESEVVDKVLAK